MKKASEHTDHRQDRQLYEFPGTIGYERSVGAIWDVRQGTFGMLGCDRDAFRFTEFETLSL